MGLERIIEWISQESPRTGYPLCDFERIRYEVRQCDVLLIEGRSRVSQVIKQITQSSWSHSCLYLGRLHDIDDVDLRARLTEHFDGKPNVQLVLEGYLGKGTIISSLENYRDSHIRICRPRGLSRPDAQRVMAHAINQLGLDYDVRQILDLARFLFPWTFLPSRFRSTLFEHNAGETTKTVCSTIIAEAFGSINFPILPLIKHDEESGIELIKRNPRLSTPRDFDYSPYFEIIKYPFLEFDEQALYRRLPWNESGLLSNDAVGIFDPSKPKKSKKSKKEIKKTPPLAPPGPETSDGDDMKPFPP